MVKTELHSMWAVYLYKRKMIKAIIAVRWTIVEIIFISPYHLVIVKCRC